VSGLGYIPRIVDDEIRPRLAAFGAVVIGGPKACGKTRTAREHAASEVLLDVDQAARAAAAIDPKLLLEGDTPRLIDEWQLEPALWNTVRRAVDDRSLPGQFILTGSSNPADDMTRHTGAARIARIQMRPMSLVETGHSNGAISLEGLLQGEVPRSADPGLTLTDVIDRVCVGGWPAFQRLSIEDALVGVRGYLDEISRTDVTRVDGKRRDPRRVQQLLRSLARNAATEAAITTIAADTAGPEDVLARDTIYDYLDALTRLMIVEDQPAWSPHLRSRAQARTTSTRHFVDPSLAVAALAASPSELIRDLSYFGYLFESLVVRDLRIYAQAFDGSVMHYRDNTGLEVDAIVQTRGGSWGAFEVKLGGEAHIASASKSLLTFAQRVDTAKIGPPATLAVVVATGYAYQRPEGVAVVPIGALGR
jgi:predicted AAA+ superfamily ATPase